MLGEWLEGRLKMGFRGGEGRAQAEARTQLDFAGHQLT